MPHDEHDIGRPAPEAADLRPSRDAIDALNRQSRTLMEAWMLPRDKCLTDEQLDDVRQSFAAYLKANALSVARVADPIGYGASTLSEWLAGKYAGDASAVARKVNDWIERDARRAKAKRPAGYIPTQVAEDMRTIILTADKSSMMAAIVAPSGCGKTFVLHSLVDVLNAVYVRCDDTCSPIGLLRRLAKQLGAKHASQGTRSELQDWCVERLASKRHAIFLDEAHQLGPQAIATVRTLHDVAGVTVILVGTVAILNAVNDRSDGRGQFSRRCIRYNLLDYVRNVAEPRGDDRRRMIVDKRDLFSVDEVKAFFDLKRIKLRREALDMLWLLACLPNYGTLGFAEKVAYIAIDLAGDEASLDRAMVIGSLQLVMGEEFSFLQRLLKQHRDASAARPVEAAATA